MTIETLEQFIILLNEDFHLDRFIKSTFASHYDHASQTSINTANEVAADHTYDELISDAFTENIVFTIEESKLKEYLIDRYGFTLGFVQSGL